MKDLWTMTCCAGRISGKVLYKSAPAIVLAAIGYGIYLHCTNRRVVVAKKN